MDFDFSFKTKSRNDEHDKNEKHTKQKEKSPHRKEKDIHRREKDTANVEWRNKSSLSKQRDISL